MTDIISVQQRLEKLYNQVDKITEIYHKTKTDFDNLDKQEKSVLAQIATGFEGSEAKRTREALASDRYKSYKKATKMAREAYNKSSALLKGLELKLDILRSLNKHLN